MGDLFNKQCKPCDGDTQHLTQEEISVLLNQLDSWTQSDQIISKVFEFNNHYQTIAFVNALAWISHREDHHPDMKVGYNKCCIEYTTHSVGGLSENDFICAAKVDSLLKI
jgi:4a-hydroxytetrahydrobiopterin dehydratase